MGTGEDEGIGLHISALMKSPDTTKSLFFELRPPIPHATDVQIADLAKRLFADEHLLLILRDHALFEKFSVFINRFKPQLAPTLVRYLEMRKAMKAIEYANAVARKIRWPSHTDFCKFSAVQAATVDVRFDDYATKELNLLVTEALPAWITYNLTNIVVDCVAKDITGHGVSTSQNLVGSLAEVFCITDPSVPGNPIVYATEEFYRTTQYGTGYAIDRNCRFLQGPGTQKSAKLRFSQAIAKGQEINETILNYRRDGTPFMNLCMVAPLFDDKGHIRYFIGAQNDVSGLVEEGRGIESFRALLHDQTPIPTKEKDDDIRDPRLFEHGNTEAKKSIMQDRTQNMLGKLQELSSMFSQDEADIALRNCRAAGSEKMSDTSSIHSGVPTIHHVRGQSHSKRATESEDTSFGYGLSQLNLNQGGSLPGVYKHYLLVRPYPSLQIMFVSPSLRLPGLLRAHLFSKLGGPRDTLSALEEAFKDGAAVTTKILWLPKHKGQDDDALNVGTEMGREARPRWIRCTPLLGSDDKVGVWMVVLVPVEGHTRQRSNKSEIDTEDFGRPPTPGVLGKGMNLEDKHNYEDSMERERGNSRSSNRHASIYVNQATSDAQNIKGHSRGMSSSSRVAERMGTLHREPISERPGSRTGRDNRGRTSSPTFGFRGSTRSRGRAMDDESEKDLYAEYLRNSSTTGRNSPRT